jgi:hypothetical protein
MNVENIAISFRLEAVIDKLWGKDPLVSKELEADVQLDLSLDGLDFVEAVCAFANS